MTIFTSKNILKAYLNCRKNKRQTINAIQFELDQENNLTALRHELTSRNYQPYRSICFIITEPKPREIFAADFRDRIVHHILINEVEDIFEKQIFIENSYACRKGKGHHFGMYKFSQFVKEHCFYGQFDISNFFASIDKTILFNHFSGVILDQPKPDFWKEEILWLAKVIIFNNPAKKYIYKGNPVLKKFLAPGKSLFDQNEGTGMPIGNLTSQFLANVYLNELDHFVNDSLGCSAYGRYVDDFVLFSDIKDNIIQWRDQISCFLENRLRLKLHPKKTQIQPTSHGVPFVGYFIKPWGVTVRKNVVKTAKNKIFLFNKEQNSEKMVSSLNSYFGHFGKAKTDRLRKHIISSHLSNEIKSKIVVIGNWHHLRIRNPQKSKITKKPKT